MKIRLYNARILDLNNVHSIRKGEIHVSDSLIENVLERQLGRRKDINDTTAFASHFLVQSEDWLRQKMKR